MAFPAPADSSPATPAAAASAVSEAEENALRRAARSLRCLPFRRAFYQQVDGQAMGASELCARSDWAQLVFAPFGVQRAEAHFRWLIRLGVLRREVDGQGLTERV
ncbi:MAG: Npun_F0494 family protein, partial [Cyanobium sp.]